MAAQPPPPPPAGIPPAPPTNAAAAAAAAPAALNAAALLKYSRVQLAPIQMDLVTGEMVVKVDRAGTRMGYLEARGRTLEELQQTIHRTVSQLKAANNAEALAADAAKQARDAAAAEAKAKAAKLALDLKKSDAVAAASRIQARKNAGQMKTSFLGRDLGKIYSQTGKNIHTLRGQVKTANTAAQEAKQASTEAAAEALRQKEEAERLRSLATTAAGPQKGFFSRMFGLGGGGRSRKNRCSTRRARASRRSRRY